VKFERIWLYLALLVFSVTGVGCSSGEPSVDVASSPSAFSVVEGSTEKICQLTGEYDYHTAAEAGIAPEEMPTLNRTYSNYGIHGTDLGSSFEHNGKLWFLFGDTLATEMIPGDPINAEAHSGPNPFLGDATAYTGDTDPTDCVSLEFLRNPAAPDFWGWPSFDPDGHVVQHEGFSIGSSFYVWYSTGGDNPVSYLARSDDDGGSYTVLYDVSDYRFTWVSVDFAPALVIPGLEDVGETDWLFIFGTGPIYRESDMFLGIIPLALIEEPQAMVYFAGLNENALPQWSESEEAAQPVIDIDNPLATGDWFAGVELEEKANAEGCIGEFSVHYSEVLETWTAMYNCDFLSIEMHTADLPWGPWSQAVTVFDPVKDGGYCGFLHLPEDIGQVLDLDCDYNVTVQNRSNLGSPYGPYILERYTTGDRDQATLYFVMSMWHPYNVLLMRTEVERR